MEQPEPNQKATLSESRGPTTRQPKDNELLPHPTFYRRVYSCSSENISTAQPTLWRRFVTRFWGSTD